MKRSLLQHMECMSENQLNYNFQEQSKHFCNYIFTGTKPKTIREGIIVTGNRESPLLQHVSLQFIVCDCTQGLSVVLFPALSDMESRDSCHT